MTLQNNTLELLLKKAKEFEKKYEWFQAAKYYKKASVIVLDEKDVLKELEIIELQSILNTPEVPKIPPKDPEEGVEKKSEYNLEYHFDRKKTTKKTRELYQELDEEIKKIDDSIWVKYARTAIT